MPAVTHWQSPRFFAYFANTGSEPGVLAELLSAGLNQVGILWRTSPALQELEEVTLDWLAQLLGLPDGLHGHIEDTASTCTMAALAAARHARPGAASSSPPSTRTRRSRRRAGCSSSKRGRRRSTTRSGSARTRSTSWTPAPSWPRSGRRRRARSIRSTRSRTLRGRRRLAARRRRLRRLGGGVPRAARGTSPAGSAPTRSSSTRTSGCYADGLLDALDAPARRPARGVQPRAGVPAASARRWRASRVQPGARPPLPRAQALGGAALLRPRRAAGADPRGDPPGRAVRGLGARGAGLGGRRAAAVLPRLLPPRRRPTRRTRRCSSASTRRARSSSRHEAERALRRCGSRSATRARPRTDVRLAWDVLRREAGSGE